MATLEITRPDLSAEIEALPDRDRPPRSQKELAAATGIDPSAISRYAHGLRPHRRHARLITKALS